MTPEIEEEINARIHFKIEELITGLKNTARHNWGIAFSSGNPKYAHYWEAFEQMVKMIYKERDMPPPYDEIVLTKKRKARDAAVDAIMDKIRPISMGRFDDRHILQAVVRSIEEAQNYNK